ncbi:hypothetical protein BAE44_0009726 [Dichanthelium oligosanthes]|uniref:Wall-associated receptor kinase C-terminal domain-containing protein n=1 Tax=Dichanthelium oligosanthes TaxID=888268 RepID=A0A1E5VVY5_9POAL|nr:hypothetical protein BAE44_0009726 [Dichanthelium oligosanthes]
MVNASTDLGLSPYRISKKNKELFFLYGDCDRGRERRALQPLARVNCTDDSSSSFALLAGHYTPGDTKPPMPLPVNCNVSVLPVLAYEGAEGEDYQRLMKAGKAGFLLEYTDDGVCAACTESGGQCRVNATTDASKCHCTDGEVWFICGEYVYACDLVICSVGQYHHHVSVWDHQHHHLMI